MKILANKVNWSQPHKIALNRYVLNALHKHNLPAKSSCSVILVVATNSGLLLITTSHWYNLPSSVVVSRGIVKLSTNRYESFKTDLTLILSTLFSCEPYLSLHTISILIVIPFKVVTLHSSISGLSTIWVLVLVTLILLTKQYVDKSSQLWCTQLCLKTTLHYA